jgi:hypothetical protein
MIYTHIIILIIRFHIEGTVNQLLFGPTLFRDLSKINWLVVINFTDRALFLHIELNKRIGSR